MTKFRLSDILLGIVILALACFGISSAHAQQTTERYIPIGQSPGISDKYSYIGDIVAVDAAAHTIVVDSNRGRRTVEVTADTRIWLDRSTIKQTNAVGSYTDCEVGRKVEVMHKRDDESVAAWIKIETQ